MKKVFKIEIDCANCAAKVEEAINKIEGVNQASLNYMTQKMIIDIDDANFDSIMKQVKKVGRKIEPDFEILD
ncbi:MAG: heavy-metal-associated domain-containing protein [Erysipelotrichaceae bacterium]|nr:heavy-metal-associated domain-containing protein [Erysipelotrichaceae bacterium]